MPVTWIEGTRAATQRAATPVPIPASNRVSPGAARDRGGKENRIDSSPIALFGLKDPELSAKEAVLGQRRRQPRPRGGGGGAETLGRALICIPKAKTKR